MQIWMQKCVPQHGISRCLGKLAHCRIRWLKNFLIRLFIQHYQVDLSEAEHEDYREYVHFNAFFTRLLKPGARPMPQDPQALACPVDGEVSQLGAIHGEQIFQAKGHAYSLEALLGGDASLANLFHNGEFLTAYLSPKDYHRVHMPIAGRLKKMIHVPGALFSVNHETVENVDGLFARNERVVCLFETEVGPMAVILVAAIVVAGIVVPWHGRVTPPKQQAIQEWNYSEQEIYLKRGEEMGLFEVGSTAIILFPENTMQWHDSLESASLIRLGQEIGKTRNWGL